MPLIIPERLREGTHALDAKLTLWTSPGKSGLAPHMALRACEAAHEIHWVNLGAGEHKRPPFLALNPFATVPVLEVGDRSITETGAILFAIAELYPSSGLLPAGADERQTHMSWLFHAAAIHADFMTSRRSQFAPIDPIVAEGVRSWMTARLATAWRAVEAGMRGPFLNGDNYGIADLYLLMVAAWSRGRFGFAAETPRLRLLLESLTCLPFVAEVYRIHGLTLPDFSISAFAGAKDTNPTPPATGRSSGKTSGAESASVGAPDFASGKPS